MIFKLFIIDWDQKDPRIAKLNNNILDGGKLLLCGKYFYVLIRRSEFFEEVGVLRMTVQ